MVFYHFCSKHRWRVHVEHINVVVLRSTHNQWFRAKIRQIIYTHIHPQLANSITMVLRPLWLSSASSTISNIHLTNQSPISCGDSLGRGGGRKVCINDSVHMTRMAAVLIYAKNLKDLLLRNQWTELFRKDNSLWPESCYMQGMRALKVNIISWP